MLELYLYATTLENQHGSVHRLEVVLEGGGLWATSLEDHHVSYHYPGAASLEDQHMVERYLYASFPDERHMLELNLCYVLDTNSKQLFIVYAHSSYNTFNHYIGKEYGIHTTSIFSARTAHAMMVLVIYKTLMCY